MSNLGMGVMIKMLGGRDGLTEAQLNWVKNQTIEKITLTEDSLSIFLPQGRELVLWDGGQSCCESRYMTTDDQPEDFTGARLVDMQLNEAEEAGEGQYDSCHEIMFLRILTDKGTFTVSTHNEHNGYYGGFAIEARLNGWE